MRTTGMQLRRIMQLELLQLLALVFAVPEQRAERLHVVDGVEPEMNCCIRSLSPS